VTLMATNNRSRLSLSSEEVSTRKSRRRSTSDPVGVPASNKRAHEQHSHSHIQHTLILPASHRHEHEGAKFPKWRTDLHIHINHTPSLNHSLIDIKSAQSMTSLARPVALGLVPNKDRNYGVKLKPHDSLVLPNRFVSSDHGDSSFGLDEQDYSQFKERGTMTDQGLMNLKEIKNSFSTFRHNLPVNSGMAYISNAQALKDKSVDIYRQIQGQLKSMELQYADKICQVREACTRMTDIAKCEVTRTMKGTLHSW
jgi:hypothetical protein